MLLKCKFYRQALYYAIPIQLMLKHFQEIRLKLELTVIQQIKQHLIDLYSTKMRKTIDKHPILLIPQMKKIVVVDSASVFAHGAHPVVVY